jgi:hypothetical protein
MHHMLICLYMLQRDIHARLAVHPQLTQMMALVMRMMVMIMVMRMMIRLTSRCTHAHGSSSRSTRE